MKFFILLILFINSAHAFEFEAKLENPEKERQAQQIFKDMRCVVCDGESLSGSNAEFSVDMRALIRQKLESGDTKEDVVEFLVSRYGDVILQKPPIKTSTYALWFSPLILLVIGFVFIRRVGRNEN